MKTVKPEDVLQAAAVIVSGSLTNPATGDSVRYNLQSELAQAISNVENALMQSGYSVQESHQ